MFIIYGITNKTETMGSQKEFIQQVERLKKDFDFAADLAININADRLSHLDKIAELELKLRKMQREAEDWIDVNERLPEEGGRYWCYVQHLTDLGFSYFQWNCDYNPQMCRFSDMTLTKGEIITHWRYLPEPPKQYLQQKG
jgi:hypothetical protein